MQNDKEFEVYIVSKATAGTFSNGTPYIDLRFEDFGGLVVENSNNLPIPPPGSIVKLFGEGFGFPVRGVIWNDYVYYYYSSEAFKQKKQKEIEDSKIQQRKEYEDNKEKRDADYNSLPDCFKSRIDRFNRVNKDFWEYEPYEMFCCTEAVLIANALKTIEEIDSFYKKPFEEQSKLVPGLSNECSGNTFGTAVSLARFYIENKEYVIKFHGAMCPLVGCKKYGCYAVYQEEK